jgi:hypothetical protein
MMKSVISCAALLLLAGSAAAQTIITGDGGATSFGDTQGFAIDFDSTAAANADWTPDLVGGQSYSVRSVSVTYGGAQDAANAAPKYLGVYSGLTAGALSGFLGASTNSVDYATSAAGDLKTFLFSGVNVTADSTVGAGSGLLYFVYQDAQAALGALPAYDVSTRRFENGVTDPGLAMTNTLSNIISFGGLNNNRAPEYQAVLAPVPEPTAAALAGITSVALLAVRRRRAK